MTRVDLRKFARCRILVIGDVMLDHFIWGSVRRISPEAPVPVVEVSHETWYPGGAANVARNVAPFTKHISLMGRVGCDAQAETAARPAQGGRRELRAAARQPDLPTISKARVIARQQQVVRVDRESLQKLEAAELREVERKLRAMAGKLDAIIIEDYGKGFVTAALVGDRHPPCEGGGISSSPWIPRRAIRCHGGACTSSSRTASRPSPPPASRIRTAPRRRDKNRELLRVGDSAARKMGVPRVLITLGEQGMMLFQRAGNPTTFRRARARFLTSAARATPPSRC